MEMIGTVAVTVAGQLQVELSDHPPGQALRLAPLGLPLSVWVHPGPEQRVS